MGLELLVGSRDFPREEWVFFQKSIDIFDPKMGFSKKKKKSKISIDFWNLRNFFWPEIRSC